MEDSFINSLIHPIICPLFSVLPAPIISQHISLSTAPFSLSVFSPPKSIHPFVYLSIRPTLFRLPFREIFRLVISLTAYFLVLSLHFQNTIIIVLQLLIIYYSFYYIVALMPSFCNVHFIDFLAHLLQKPIVV